VSGPGATGISGAITGLIIGLLQVYYKHVAAHARVGVSEVAHD
jgi:hypothetical protein